MNVRVAYQTLDYRNVESVETEGPFECKKKNAWLGNGYYFWDSFLNNAHLWGNFAYNSNYLICQSTFELDENKCFNLLDNPSHIKEFNEAISLLTEKKLYKSESTTVARVIEFLKNNNTFKYEAIRVNGINSFSKEKSNRIFFKISGYQYLELSPAIQICFINKNSLSRKDFKIVYPLNEFSDYLI